MKKIAYKIINTKDLPEDFITEFSDLDNLLNYLPLETIEKDYLIVDEAVFLDLLKDRDKKIENFQKSKKTKDEEDRIEKIKQKFNL